MAGCIAPISESALPDTETSYPLPEQPVAIPFPFGGMVMSSRREFLLQSVVASGTVLGLSSPADACFWRRQQSCRAPVSIQPEHAPIRGEEMDREPEVHGAWVDGFMSPGGTPPPRFKFTVTADKPGTADISFWYWAGKQFPGGDVYRQFDGFHVRKGVAEKTFAFPIKRNYYIVCYPYWKFPITAIGEIPYFQSPRVAATGSPFAGKRTVKFAANPPKDLLPLFTLTEVTVEYQLVT
jgi:hypothetical protein